MVAANHVEVFSRKACCAGAVSVSGASDTAAVLLLLPTWPLQVAWIVIVSKPNQSPGT